MRLLVLALGGLAAAALSTPSIVKDTTSTGDEPPFLNDPTRRVSYHCSIAQPDVVEEYVKVGDLNVVNPIFTCPRGDCYEFETGVTCGESTVDVKARAATANSQDDPYYKCSKDRASILICQYGFCSTDHYCNLDGPGALCQDDCICCKKGKAANKRETFELSTSAASSPQTLEYKIAPQPPVARAESSEQPALNQGCPIAGYFICDTTFTQIFVCSPLKHWKLSADCYPGHCVHQRDEGTAWCVGGREPLKSESFPAESEGNIARAPVPQVADQTCNVPGHYGCSGDKTRLVVCSLALQWETSADCRLGSCLQFEHGIAYCVGSKGSSGSDLAARTAVPEQPPVKGMAPSGRCEVVGQYLCDQQFDAIAVCNSLHQWVLSADCRPGKCFEPSNGLPYCGAKEPTRGLDTRAAAIEKQPCDTPGFFQCDYYGKKILVCSPKSGWVVSADCSPGECHNGPNNNAFCDADKLVSGLDQREADDTATNACNHVIGGCNEPGQYRCNKEGDEVWVCDPSCHWQLSAHCPGQCINGGDGTAFCG
ncbi:hypothetical protein NX059_008360 [Plenodomus lindquistii]|nr:hypothetical protein NX059_008360 [Plenodomus lindquistii]